MKLNVKEEMNNTKTYKVKTPLGSAGNTEFWTEQDWAEHRAHVEQLKAEGRLEEPYQVVGSIVNDPGFSI